MDVGAGNPLGPTVEGSELNIASQAQGDILYYNGTSWVRLAAGTANQILVTNGAAANPSWETAQAYSAVGTYTGDGGTSHGITGLGFQPKYVFVSRQGIAATGNRILHQKFSSDGADNCYTHNGATHNNIDGIGAGQEGVVSIDADGFTVSDGGGDNDPNANGLIYVYFAVG